MTGAVENLARITQGVLETYPTTGMYDLVLKVGAADEIKLRNVLNKIKKIPGVGATLTSIIYK